LTVKHREFFEILIIFWLLFSHEIQECMRWRCQYPSGYCVHFSWKNILFFKFFWNKLCSRKIYALVNFFWKLNLYRVSHKYVYDKKFEYLHHHISSYGAVFFIDDRRVLKVFIHKKNINGCCFELTLWTSIR
jgi:hypothetical protein